MKLYNIGCLVAAVYGGVGCSAPALDLGSQNGELNAAEAPATAAGGGTSTSETTGDDTETSAAESSTGSADAESSQPIPDFLLAHCEMEARCVSRCSCPELEAQGLSRECPCASPTRIAACPADAQEWFYGYGDTAVCRESMLALVECMNQASCPEVQAFLKAHPDDVILGTPCYDEYHALNCANYEPLQQDGRY